MVSRNQKQHLFHWTSNRMPISIMDWANYCGFLQEIMRGLAGKFALSDRVSRICWAIGSLWLLNMENREHS